MYQNKMPLTNKIGTEAVGERRASDGKYVVYVGGRHIIVCDGVWHGQINEDGSEQQQKSLCKDWSPACPAKLAMDKDIGRIYPDPFKRFRTFYVVECVTHNQMEWDPKQQKEVKPRLFLNDPKKGSVIANDVIWLQSITRPDSGTYFTRSAENALRFETEDKADEKVTEIVLELGYLPSDVVAAKMEEEIRDEA